MALVFLKPESYKAWDKGGKQEFTKLCKGYLKDKDLDGTQQKDAKRVVYELFCTVVKGHLKPEQAAAVLGDLSESYKDVMSLSADILSILDIETISLDRKDERDKFLALVHACQKFLPDEILKERLDQGSLEALGLIQSQQAFQQKYVKTKTKLYYKQLKFNLLREESEGYAKLVTELNQDFSNCLSADALLKNIKSLIGCFNLDPNRVLDIVLDTLECRPDQAEFFVMFLKGYMKKQDTVCHMLGFKFHFYQESSELETPVSLYKMAALLLKHNLIQLDSLYPHLYPSDDVILEEQKKEVTEARLYARKLAVVSLSDKKDEEKENPAEKEKEKNDKYLANQKLGLIEALIKIGDWEDSKAVMDRLPHHFATSYQQIAEALVAMVHSTIDPLYAENSGLPKAVLKNRTKPRAQCSTPVKLYPDMTKEVVPMLQYLGPNLSCDPLLMVKIVRIGRTFMTKRSNATPTPEMEEVFRGFLTVLDEALLPSLSLCPCNCCLSEEIWSFLKMFPYTLRYRLYGQWKNSSYNQHPKLLRLKADCNERAKYIMKRLSKENVKPLGRQIGKLCHGNPGILFEYVLSTIQRYDNFIGPVVDSLKYLTSLSYDILAYCIIEALANPSQERMKVDDTNISLWLQSLANFAASIFRKYQVELAGLLQYVANQLKANKSYDLLVLREIIQKMAGIEISEEITDDQLHAMAGGEMLRQEGGNFAQVRNTKKSSVKLKESLLEHDLALPLCILMAQQRDGIIFTDQDDETHLKLVGKLYDQCQDTLVQLGSFLSTHISTDEFAQRLPKIETLCDTYHMPADAAFSILRPGYAHSIQTKFDELRKIDKSNKLTSTAQKTKRYLEAVEEVIEPLQKQVIPLHGPKIWDELSPQFYVTFWTLSMYDLQSPSEVYEKQIQALKTQQTAIEDNHSLSSSKQKKERDRCIALREKLEDEEKKQVEHINRAMARLDEEKDTWFALKTSTKNEMVTQLLQLCIFPRCVFTAIDAHYCAKFIHVLHTLKTNNFSTLLCYDRIFCDITYTVSVCTENEAHRYGRFLNACLDSIMRWHSSKEHYDKECANFPGFITVFRTAKKNSNQPDTLDYENYRHVVHKWQYTMTKAMVCCLESQNYVQIRNALIVLTRILNHYPKVQQFGQALERRVDRIKTEEKEKRPDIYALAMGYTGQLKSKKSSWVAENQFHHKEKPVGKPNGTAASGGTASKSSGASKDASKESKESENNLTGSKDEDRPEKEKKSSSKSDSKTENSKVKASNSTSSEKVKASSSTSNEKVKASSSTSNEKVKASSSTSDRKESSSARSSKERDLTSERKSSSKDREKSREKGQGDDKPHKEKSSHKDRKEEKVASDDKEKRRSHKHKEEKEERKERSRSKERDRGDHAVASSGSSHRRSAEPSPKHSELERESKRRKMEAPSVKDSPHNDVKDSHKSSSRQGSEERESQSKKDRKRVSYPDDRSAEKEDKDAKRRRSEDPSGKRQMNGESSRSSKSKGEAQSSPSTTERKVKAPKEDKEKDRERKRHSKESKRRE